MARTGCTWRSSRAPTADGWARTAWTPSTRSTPIPATTRSRISRPTCRCACCATSCALPSKVPHMAIAKDGRFICYGPAGGGYGNPLERDPAKVADDVLDGVISIETALSDYGVVVSTTGVVDRAATE